MISELLEIYRSPSSVARFRNESWAEAINGKGSLLVPIRVRYELRAQSSTIGQWRIYCRSEREVSGAPLSVVDVIGPC